MSDKGMKRPDSVKYKASWLIDMDGALFEKVLNTMIVAYSSRMDDILK